MDALWRTVPDRSIDAMKIIIYDSKTAAISISCLSNNNKKKKITIIILRDFR